MGTEFLITIPVSNSYTAAITEPETGAAATGTLTQYLPVDVPPTNLISVTLEGSVCEWAYSVWNFNHYFYRPSVGFRGRPVCGLIPGQFNLHSTTSGTGHYIADGGLVQPFGCVGSGLSALIPRPSVPPFVTLACADPGTGTLTPQGITTTCYGWTWHLRQVSGVLKLTLYIGGDFSYTTSIPYKARGTALAPWISYFGYFVGSTGNNTTWGVAGGPGGAGFPGSEPNLYAEVNWEGTFNCSQTTRPLRVTLNLTTVSDGGLTLLNLAEIPSSIILVGA